MSQAFWATKPSEQLVEDLSKKIEDYDKYLASSGIMSEMRDSYKAFYGDSKIRDAGQQGELKSIQINHYASLIRNLVSLVTNNKPAWQPIASNTDSASQASAILASGLLDFYMKDRRLDRVFRNACLMTCFLKEAWISTTWDTQQGEVVHPGDDTTTPIHEGDLKYGLFQLNDVIRDYAKNNSEFDWLISREYANKWDLCAQFPEFAETIQNFAIKPVDMARIRLNYRPSHNKNEEDLIPFYTFYFKPSASLPNGRMVTFIDGQYLTDGPLPYPKIPLVRISAEDAFESCFAHSPMFDVLPIQAAINTLASTLITNNMAFGVQNIWSKKGNAVTVSQVSSGLNFIESEIKPEPLQLTASAPESYRLFDMLVQQSQLISGINDAIRGQTNAGTSGAALALLSQQAIQFANGLQQGFVALIEDVGTLSIQILQRYANTKRVAVLTGKHNRPLLKEWNSEDLQGISRITIESGNALSKTASGRLTMADSLMQGGFIKSGEQYLSVLQTGNLEPLLESETSQLLRIRRENEMLQEGKPVRAILTDDHSLDIREHMTILDSPDVRANDKFVDNVLAHVQEHIDLAKSMPPELSQMLQRVPIQGAPPQGQGGPQPGGPGPEPAQVTDATNLVTQAAQQVSNPKMPVNPATGQRIEG